MDSLLFGSTSRAITAALGISSRTRSSRFADSASANKLTPVALRPGRLKLTTMPSCIGSPEIKTVGISLVALARWSIRVTGHAGCADVAFGPLSINELALYSEWPRESIQHKAWDEGGSPHPAVAPVMAA